MATLKDIANKTGLSIGTISRVLNYDQTLIISDEKKRLILQVADELNYKTLQERKMDDGSILILQTSKKSYELQDPYFMSLKNGAENYVKNKKINYKSVYLDEINIGDLKKYLGIVVIGVLANDAVDEMIKQNKNIIFLENNPLVGNYNTVNVDLPRIAKDVAEYFSLKKNKVVYFGPLSNKEKYDLRQEGFKSAALFHGLKYDQVYTSMDVIEAYSSAIKYFSDVTEQLGVFCANDNVAIGVLRAVRELGIKIPEQIEIIGINNIPASEFLDPPLSTVNLPSEFMGEYAVKMLLDNIEHNIEVPINHVISTEIIHRGTTKT